MHTRSTDIDAHGGVDDAASRGNGPDAHGVRRHAKPTRERAHENTVERVDLVVFERVNAGEAHAKPHGDCA